MGGRLVIGVAEKQKGIFVREGVKPTDKSTYNPDIMKDQLAKYADPFVEIAVVHLDEPEKNTKGQKGVFSKGCFLFSDFKKNHFAMFQ